jgi:hypothetical protein
MTALESKRRGLKRKEPTPSAAGEAQAGTRQLLPPPPHYPHPAPNKGKEVPTTPNVLFPLTGTAAAGGGPAGGDKARGARAAPKAAATSSTSGDEAYWAVGEDEDSKGVSKSRRRSIIKHIYEVRTEGDVPPADKKRALEEVRSLEAQWMSTAQSKQDYQQMVRSFMDQLHQSM